MNTMPKSWDDVNGTAHFTREGLFHEAYLKGLREALYLVDHTQTEGKMSERRAIANAIEARIASAGTNKAQTKNE